MVSIYFWSVQCCSLVPAVTSLSYVRFSGPRCVRACVLVSMCRRLQECVCSCALTNWITGMVLWMFKAHVWVNKCSVFALRRPGYWRRGTFVLFTLAVRYGLITFMFDTLMQFFFFFPSFLILSVALCGSSLEDSHLHKQWRLSSLKLVCWRHHVTWRYLVLNVLAIFMVDKFYIYAVVQIFFILFFLIFFYFQKCNVWI